MRRWEWRLCWEEAQVSFSPSRLWHELLPLPFWSGWKAVWSHSVCVCVSKLTWQLPMPGSLGLRGSKDQR